MSRCLLAAVHFCAALLVALPALAAPPERDGPDPTRERPAIQPPTPDQVRCEDPNDPRCRSNPCAGATEIYGYDEATCAPCLTNSVAALSNRACTCIDGFVETDRDTWGRVTCVAAGDVEESQPPAPTLVDIAVNAEQFYEAVRQAGYSLSIGTEPSVMTCRGWATAGYLQLEAAAVPTLSQIMPTPYDGPGPTCTFTLFGAQLQNAWQFIGPGPIDTSECRGFGELPDTGYDIAKRTSDPADTTLDVSISTWAGSICMIAFETVRLRGPAGRSWVEAF